VLWAGEGRALLRDDFIRGGVALGWCLFTGASAATTLLASVQTRQPLLRNRIRYLVAFLLLVITGQVAFLANYWTLGSLICLPGVLVAAYATLTPRLPSLQRAIQRSLSYLITTGMALLFYLAALSLSLRAFQATQGSSPWLVGALLAAALAVFFTPLLGQVQKWIDHLIAGVSHDLHISNAIQPGHQQHPGTGLVGQSSNRPDQQGFGYLTRIPVHRGLRKWELLPAARGQGQRR
jgi:hypothetical protein